MTARRQPCSLSGPDAQAARAEYRRLHEGRPADALTCEPVPAPVGGRTALGQIEEIQYRKLVLDGPYSYWHPHEENTGPMLLRDRAGKLFAWGRRYTVTDRGIEDVAGGRLTRRAENRTPRRLVALGPLEWIKYRNEHGPQILRFNGASRPILAKDETGKLHFLRGRYKVEEDPMAHRRRRSRRHSAVMANPRRSGGSFVAQTQKYGLGFLAVGAGAFAAIKLLDYGMARWAPRMQPYLRAGLELAIGVVGGVALYRFNQPVIAAGVGTGGVIGALNSAWDTYRARAALGAGTSPGGGVFRLNAGRGNAAGYSAYARQRTA